MLLLIAVVLVSMSSQTSAPQSLPTTVDVTLRQRYANVGPVRYAAALADLNGDEKPEIVVYVMGPNACTRAGCDTIVFSPDGDGYRQVTQISITNPPLRVSSRSSQGWRNLIVLVFSGRTTAHHAELEYDGNGYPINSTLPPAYRAADIAGAEVLIPENIRFSTANVLIQ